MYILADCIDELQDEYAFAAPLVKRAKDEAFKAALEDGILDLFAALHKDVDRTCQERSFWIESIAVTIPAHWTLEFEDVYTSILTRTFWSEERKPQITFISEIEALVHALVKDRPVSIGLNTTAPDYVCLFQDFGGHSSVCHYTLETKYPNLRQLTIPIPGAAERVFGLHKGAEPREWSENKFLPARGSTR